MRIFKLLRLVDSTSLHTVPSRLTARPVCLAVLLRKQQNVDLTKDFIQIKKISSNSKLNWICVTAYNKSIMVSDTLYDIC